MLSATLQWTVRKLENGNYTLILEQGGPRWLSKGIGENVVVEIMPLPGQWAIHKHPHLEYSSVPHVLMSFIDNTANFNLTRIEVPSDRWPTRAWTLDHTNPGSEVRKIN